MKPIRTQIVGFRDYLKHDIWNQRPDNLPLAKKLWTGIIRIILMVSRGVKVNQFQLRASSLTFFSFLSIVPLLAMAFGFSKMFGLEKTLEKELMQNFPGQEEVLIRVIEMARSLLESTKGGAIVGVGIIMLLWAVIKVFSNIEQSFNAIWKVRKSRPFGRKFSDYISIILVCLLLFIMSGSITVFIRTQITRMTEAVSLLGMVSPAIFFALKFMPLCLMWILFTMIYMIMPNTSVHWTSGLAAGLIAGTVYQVAQWTYINFQIDMASYNAIYGSFAALPLFLIWLQASWFIVLFGAEISYSCQHVEFFEPDLPPGLTIEHFSQSSRILCGLRITCLLVNNFSKADPALTGEQISRELGIPRAVTDYITDELTSARILSPIAVEDGASTAFQPARDIHDLTVRVIMDAMMENGAAIPGEDHAQDALEIQKIMDELSEIQQQSPANKSLLDI